jgi:hypothetical protein
MTGTRPRLLLYLGDASDPTRLAVAPALAAAAGRAGWGFDCYYDALRCGRHFGGPTPEDVGEGRAAGSPFAGGAHEAKLLWLATRFQIAAVGDPVSSLLPALEAAGADMLALTTEPARVYEAAFAALSTDIPSRLIVVDGRPQGPGSLVIAPYVYPAFLADEPALGVDVSADEQQVARLEALGAHVIEALFVDEARASGFPRRLELAPGHATYESLTTAIADRWSAWGAGVLLGDPDLVAAQLPKAARLRLLPLYGRPQVDVIRRAEQTIRSAREPVYGRQYDDRDFVELARLGKGLQVLDPSPPFDAAAVATPLPIPASASAPDLEPDDRQLEQWADEGRVLLTLLFWGGMIRELDCYGPLFDLVAEADLRAGLVLTAESLEHAGGTPISLLTAPRERGGVFGLVEPLLGSTGRGVAAESMLPAEVLAAGLAEARAASARLLPPGLEPRGWWPLLDSPLVSRRPRPFGLHDGRPVVLLPPRSGGGRRAGEGTRLPANRDLRDVVGSVARRVHLDGFTAERRPYELARPGAADDRVSLAVRSAGFTYMWTKTSFGRCTPRLLGEEFLTLPLTAGSWDGWSPFYTVARSAQLRRAERRLRRGRRPGWLAGTIDSPLWLLPGELREHGRRVQELALFAAKGGASGELVNVTPNVVARYARLLLRRGLCQEPTGVDSHAGAAHG